MAEGIGYQNAIVETACPLGTAIKAWTFNRLVYYIGSAKISQLYNTIQSRFSILYPARFTKNLCSILLHLCN